MSSFEDRLATARQALQIAQHHADRVPEWFVDQVLAATADTHAIVAATAQVDESLTPHEAPRPASLVEVLVAAVLGCTSCDHLQATRPALAQLGIGRVDCLACARQRRPPAEDDDTCDLCERSGVREFWPFIVQVGALVIHGDACECCREEHWA